MIAAYPLHRWVFPLVFKSITTPISKDPNESIYNTLCFSMCVSNGGGSWPCFPKEVRLCHSINQKLKNSFVNDINKHVFNGPMLHSSKYASDI